MTGPVLKRIDFNRMVGGRKCKHTLHVFGGLNFIRGNHAPYFTLTGTIHVGRREDVSGCIHDEILRKFPSLKPLADLHLSDMDGVPMHAEANGWYWLAGAIGADEKYHGGTGTYGKTPVECLEVFAKHIRVDMDAAEVLADEIKNHDTPRAHWVELCDAMKPRWKAEADACIAALELKVFGDTWVNEEIAA